MSNGKTLQCDDISKYFELKGIIPHYLTHCATMSRHVFRPRADVCQLCDFMITRQKALGQPARTQRFFQSRSLTTTKRNWALISEKMEPLTTKQSPKRAQPIQAPSIAATISSGDLDEAFSYIRTICSPKLSPDRVTPEEEVLQALVKCNDLAESLTSNLPPNDSATSAGAASALLSLDEAPAVQSRSSNPTAAEKQLLDQLSKVAFQVVKHPTVFISPPILELYTKIQATLSKPDTFPEVFHMYAHKPAPQDGSPIRYVEQNPNKISNVVPTPTANLALQTAIDTKQLKVAMDIVETTYATQAFRRSKLVRKGLVPAAGAVALPVAAYTLATQLAHLQTTMDASLATNVAFAGIMAYTLFTGTIGIVAITTANDQMERVTWAPGIPLRERWIREEERQAIDKIAVAWGFKEKWRRGEEEGDDWDALREWIGGKGMILDRADLMEGME